MLRTLRFPLGDTRTTLPSSTGNTCPFHLELTLSRKEEIKFFMVLVCMKESRFLFRLEHLEGELTARCLKCRTSEHLSRNLHSGESSIT